jgi:decaprenylphospho-beta-D-ribofuranose 2-oxidase
MAMTTQVPGSVSLSGWGGTTRSRSRLAGPVTITELQELIGAHPGDGVLARGSGLSYGDAAQNAGGLVLCPVTPPQVELDVVRQQVTVSAAATFGQILNRVVPAGFILPALPGTRFVTAGGAVAADVHGKNHVRDGSLSAWIQQVELVDGTGELRCLTADTDPDGLQATVGGMGLTGVITSVTLRLRRVETAAMRVTSFREDNLAGVLRRLETAPAQYAVAWVDATASGPQLGRGIVDLADHASASDRAASEPSEPSAAIAPEPRYEPSPPRRAWLPPFSLMNPLTARAFNTLWYRRAPRERTDLADLATYFHRLDAVDGWNKVAGPDGILQYQFVVPDKSVSVLEDVLTAISRNRCAPFLGTLKRFGSATGGELSFPSPGWCLAIDLPAGRPQTAMLLDALDLRVADAGGRVYLAKDARLGRDAFDAMYGPLAGWRAARKRLDPGGLFQSDLGRRVGLC